MKLYLIGMPGVGKSKTGKKVALDLGYEFIDLDHEIENNYGSIEKIFSEQGEEKFREFEHLELDRVSKKDNVVIACGGGIVTNKLNLKIMRQGLIFFLDASLNIIREHLSNSSVVRPLLKDNKLEKLYEDRIDLYQEFMHFKVEYKDFESAAKSIVNQVKNLKLKKILVVNGPNINMLGLRDKNHYGSLTLDDINNLMKEDNAFQYEFFQSNTEGLIIDKLQEFKNYDGIIINPAAYTHTSVAIGDCLEIINIPIVEVHLSKVDEREDYRRVNFVRNHCDACFQGMHEGSYLNAIIYLKNILNVL